ncbi:uncharacterized protein METZ01_LOCUS323353, partial [marine metagenome]
MRNEWIDNLVNLTFNESRQAVQCQL